MKKFLAIILSLCMLFGIIPFGALSVSAGVGDYEISERESNNTMSLADRIYNDYTVSGVVSGSDMDYFKFTLSSTSSVSIITIADYKSCFLAGIFNSSEKAVAVSDFVEYSDSGYPTYLTSITLNAGTYYYVIFNKDASTLRNDYMFYFEYTTTSSHTHSYSNSCDTTCNSCGATRSTSHTYSYACDSSCNVCGATRTVSGHVYDNLCDSTCNTCGYERTPEPHQFGGLCDEACVICGVIPIEAAHIFDNNCDSTCNRCGTTRTPSAHIYSNGCDKSCNVCGITRPIGSHEFSNSCDTTCNVCGGKRTIKHTYTNNCDTKCNVCSATRTITHAYKTTTTKATLSKNGSIVKKCTVCGHTASSTIKYAKTFTLSTTSYTYDGKVKTPSVTVKDSAGKTLKKNTDYTVTYASGRKNAGTYKVTIKGKGNYTGTKTLTFKINRAKIGSCKLSATSYAYNGKAKTPTVTVKNSSGKTLKKNVDYTITYSSGRKNVGTYKVTIKGKGGYSGTKVLTFSIKPTTKTSIKITNGRTSKIGAKSNKTIKYTSSNKKVATVSVNGTITAKSVGTTTITVTSNKVSQKITVKVVKPYIKITGEKSLLINNKLTLKVATNTGAKVEWSSSNKKVATVSSSGKVTAIKEGTAKIYAKLTYKGKTYTAIHNITVKGYSSIVLYEDSSVKITFKSAEKYKYDDDRVELYFNVKNKTGKTLLIQADAVSLNGYSFCDLTMSDEVMAYSTGVINLSVDNFDFNLVSLSSIKSIGGQFRIIDDATWKSYDAIFKSIRLDGKGVASKPSFKKGKLVYSDANCAIYYKNAEKYKYDDDRAEMYFYVENKTNKTLLIQADAISVNGYSHNDLTMSDPVLAQSIGIVNLSVDEFNYSSISLSNIKTLGGQFRIIDDATWKSYNAVFLNKKVK